MPRPWDGGAAFPLLLPSDQLSYRYEPGMSLRDWFVGQALHSVIDLFADDGVLEVGAAGDLRREEAGRAAYAIADTLLALKAGARVSVGDPPAPPLEAGQIDIRLTVEERSWLATFVAVRLEELERLEELQARLEQRPGGKAATIRDHLRALLAKLSPR